MTTKDEKKKAALSRKLSTYSILAGASLAMGSSAYGGVVHTEFNPVITLTEPCVLKYAYINMDGPNNNPYDSNPESGNAKEFRLRLGNCGTAQIETMTFDTTGCTVPPWCSTAPPHFGGMVDTAAAHIIAPCLAPGDPIGPGSNFYYNVKLFEGTWATHWINKTGDNHYLGVKFKIGTNAHYGWLRMTTSGTSQITVHEFAYEDTSDTSIDAGEMPAGPEIRVEGNSVEIVDGDTTPSTGDHTDFGTTAVSGGTVIRTFTIKNTGTDALTLTGGSPVSLGGTHSGDFSVTQPALTTIPANGSTTFQVTFDPSDLGLRTATVSIANDDANEAPYDFSIQGTGAAAEMDVQGNGNSIVDGDTTPSPADDTDFGSTDIATGSVFKTFTIENTGGVDLNLTGTPQLVAITGDTDFTVTTQPTTPVASGGGTKTFTVKFDPTTTGLKFGTVSIDNDDSDENPYNFNIQGSGTSAPEMDVLGNSMEINDGDTTPSPADHTDFGSADILTGSVTRTFTIENKGSKDLNLIGGSPVSVTGDADFSVSSQPSTPVAAGGGTTTFDVTFDPSTTGLKTADVSIANDDGDENPYDFNIQGTGSAGPEMNVQGNSKDIADGDTTPDLTDHTDFGNADIVTGSVIRTFTIKNDGSADLNLDGAPLVSVTGANAGDFTVDTDPGTPLAAGGGTTTFQVTFDPSGLGQRDAAISIDNDDADEDPYNFDIQGTGTTGPEMSVQGNSVEIADEDATPDPADHTDFGNADVNGGTVTRTFTVENTGSADLNLDGTPKVQISGAQAGDFTVTTPPGSPVPSGGGTTTFEVTFDPSNQGNRNAAISIENNDGDENPYNFNIKGAGIINTNQLDVQKDGTGTGTVSSNPAGIDCGTDCSEVYVQGTPVTLSAAPNADSTFAGWTGGGCTGTGDCTVTVDADKAVTATFNLAQNTYALTIQKEGDGSGTITSNPAGIDCGGCTNDFAEGLRVILSPTPAPGSAFVGWVGHAGSSKEGWTAAECPGNGDCAVTMDQDYTVTANFSLDGDGDGVSDIVENQGPNGGDANQDGVPDSQQDNVATFQDINGNWVTLIADPGSLDHVMATVNPSPEDAPPEASFPHGFFSFRIKGLDAGAAARAVLVLHAPDNGAYSYYMHGPTLNDRTAHWYEFTYDQTTGARIARQDGKVIVVLYFKDGRRGDDDLTVNGEINDIGGPGGIGSGSPGAGGCFISNTSD